MRYYIADTHFGHENSIIFDHRNGAPYFDCVEERDNLIIENINKVVTPQDELFFLGDVSWYKPRETAELIKRIKCKNLFLVRGNHDWWVKDSLCHKLFHAIYDTKQIDDKGRKVFLSHFPVMMWPGQHRGVFHLYGHVHNTQEHDDYIEFIEELNRRILFRDPIDKYKPLNAYNVGCMIDYMNYTPRTLDEIILSCK